MDKLMLMGVGTVMIGTGGFFVVTGVAVLWATMWGKI